MSKISKSIIDRIKKNEIKPIPRWKFVLWRLLFWALFIVAVLMGSVSMGMVFHQIFGTEWGFIQHSIASPFHGLIFLSPYICWVAILAIILLIAYKIFYKTDKGYRYRPGLVISVSVLISIILGFGFYQIRATQGLEDFMRNYVKPYGEMQEYREEMWVDPEDGIILGEIIEVGDTSFTFEDASGGNWTVYFDENVELPGYHTIEAGKQAFVKGEMIDDDEFNANEVKVMGKNSQSPFAN